MSSFTPDSPLVTEVVPSPNHGERRQVRAPDMLILHYTGMPDSQAALQRLCEAAAQVSAHYFVFEDGRIVQCVAESRRAWHAGLARWGTATDINSHSIGIEIANPGHCYGYPDFPPQQIAAVIALCRDILARHAVPPHHVLAHSDVAPARKEDPGEKFPWPALHAAGIGLWVAPAPLDLPGSAIKPGEAGPTVERLQAALRRYGYGLEPTATYDAQTAAVVKAFQRHFRPARVDGTADPSTRRTLADLLAARGLDSEV
ncbi:MAG: N-acetylmuramoyl-L-alanine amidase [Variibacter sp.]|nr:N-acetylmuramoyl-L-alanine amidase [Variibacter sp.]